MATKKRLIDADVAYDMWHRTPFHLGFADLHDLKELLEDVPTVDAVEVVRCKDCKYYDNSEGICWCNLNSKFYPGGMDWHSFPEDGYCYYGERKDHAE